MESVRMNVRRLLLPLSSGLMEWGFLSAVGSSGLRAEKRNIAHSYSPVWPDQFKSLQSKNTHTSTSSVNLSLAHLQLNVHRQLDTQFCGFVCSTAALRQKSKHWQEVMYKCLPYMHLIAMQPKPCYFLCRQTNLWVFQTEPSPNYVKVLVRYKCIQHYAFIRVNASQ